MSCVVRATLGHTAYRRFSLLAWCANTHAHMWWNDKLLLFLSVLSWNPDQTLIVSLQFIHLEDAHFFREILYSPRAMMLNTIIGLMNQEKTPALVMHWLCFATGTICKCSLLRAERARAFVVVGLGFLLMAWWLPFHEPSVFLCKIETMSTISSGRTVGKIKSQHCA